MTQLPPYDGNNSQFIFDQIAKTLIDTGGRQIKIRFGSGTLTWPGGSAFATALAVSHGLGSTPVAIVVTDNGSVGAGLTHNPVLTVNTAGATTFNVSAENGDSAVSPAAATTRGFYWIAIG